MKSIKVAWLPAAHLPPADEEEAEGGGSEPELSGASGSGGSPGGSPGTLELLACDTQRILRGERACQLRYCSIGCSMSMGSCLG